MPSSPARPCAVAGCPALVGPGHARCEQHRVDLRVSRTRRGYDEDWQRLRAWFMSDPSHQLCRVCHAAGVIKLATEVDHIEPFRSIMDPRRLDPKNLQALCAKCHRQKTGADRARGVSIS
jgi:5-methylcytosine-specific restriction enzyme A